MHIPLLSAKFATLVRLPSARQIIGATLTALLFLGLYWPLQEYLRLVHEADHRGESTRELRIRPREWLQSNIPSGARITVLMHSNWANPPLDDLGYAVEYRYLSFPYLDATKMLQYRPPTMEHVLSTTDAIVINSFHHNLYLQALTNYGYTELRKDWERFFSDLRSTFPVERFEAAHANYGVNWVEIVVIR